jgi:hypothetical protein
LWCHAVPVACCSGCVVVVPLPFVLSCPMSGCACHSVLHFRLSFLVLCPCPHGSAHSPWFPSSSCCHMCSPFPPCEQLPGAVVQGALLVVVVIIVVSPCHLPPSFLSHGPLLPPHEQMLMVVVLVILIAVVAGVVLLLFCCSTLSSWSSCLHY